MLLIQDTPRLLTQFDCLLSLYSTPYYHCSNSKKLAQSSLHPASNICSFLSPYSYGYFNAHPYPIYPTQVSLFPTSFVATNTTPSLSPPFYFFPPWDKFFSASGVLSASARCCCQMRRYKCQPPSSRNQPIFFRTTRQGFHMRDEVRWLFGCLC